MTFTFLTESLNGCKTKNLNSNFLEFKANFDADRDFEEDDDLSNSGISTVNSTKVKHHANKEHHEEIKILLEHVKLLKNENSKLIHEIFESHKSLQSLLKNNDIEAFAEAMRSLTHHLSTFTRQFERSISYGYHSDDQLCRNPSLYEASPSPDEIDNKALNNVNSKKLNIPLFKNPQLKSPLRQCHDVRLNDWMLRNGFDEEARNIVDAADFTYEDLLFVADKDDIGRIGLRVGTCVRLWKMISAHRKKFGTYQAEVKGDQLLNGFTNDANSYDSNSSTTTTTTTSSYDSCNSNSGD